MKSPKSASEESLVAAEEPEAVASRPSRRSRSKAERKRGLAMTGSKNPSLQTRLVGQAVAAAPHRSGEPVELVEARLQAMKEIAPTSALEGMLAAQMIAAHENAMDCMARAASNRATDAARELNLKHAEKLMQLFTRQVEALDKHRGKGQQKIRVEHVTVQAGGQAIVGDVRTGGASQAQLPAPDPVPLHQDFSPPKREAKVRVRTRGEEVDGRS